MSVTPNIPLEPKNGKLSSAIPGTILRKHKVFERYCFAEEGGGVRSNFEI